MRNARQSSFPSVVAALTFALGAAAVAACSGVDDGSSNFPASDSDSGSAPPPSFDAGQLSDPDTGFGPTANATCAPVDLPATFKPTWRPPNGHHSGACSAGQISDFFTACLATPVDPARCSTFTQANGTCSSCLQTDDTAPSYGPVIWHDHRAFYTLNVPGCIANEQNDTSVQSCGAAYQADLECKQTSCTGCFAAANATFAAFAACEKQASQGCGVYANALHNTCGDDIHDAGAPESKCLPPSTTAVKDVYAIFAPLFCGN
jgi:hypothetical protein